MDTGLKNKVYNSVKGASMTDNQKAKEIIAYRWLPWYKKVWKGVKR